LPVFKHDKDCKIEGGRILGETAGKCQIRGMKKEERGKRKEERGKRKEERGKRKGGILETL
jgi:division protein 1